MDISHNISHVASGWKAGLNALKIPAIYIASQATVLNNRDNTTRDIWYHSAEPRALTKSWALSHNLTRVQKVKYGSAMVTVSFITNILHVVRLK